VQTHTYVKDTVLSEVVNSTVDLALRLLLDEQEQVGHEHDAVLWLGGEGARGSRG
jgi:hypothetical protein